MSITRAHQQHERVLVVREPEVHGRASRHATCPGGVRPADGCGNGERLVVKPNGRAQLEEERPVLVANGLDGKIGCEARRGRQGRTRQCEAHALRYACDTPAAPPTARQKLRGSSHAMSDDAQRDGPSPPDDGLSASEKLVERWLRCMPLEREVEKQECLEAAQSLPPRELERRGLGLHKLYIASSETALFGRVLLTLQLSGARPLPPTRLSSGTMVALRSAGAAAASGKTHVVATVSRVTNTAVSVALEEAPDEEDLPEPLTLHLLYNDVTYRRCEQANPYPKPLTLTRALTLTLTLTPTPTLSLSLSLRAGRRPTARWPRACQGRPPLL